MIKVNKLSKYYDTPAGRFHVLRELSLTFRTGEFTTIMGPSGAGKSTLLYILGFLESPSSGEYAFQNQEISTLKEKELTRLHREEIGFVFQNYHLIDELTVYENLETPMIYSKVPKGERKARIAELLDRFNIVAKRDLFPNQLSGGQQQLVGIARALINRPSLILADEPTGNLKQEMGDEIMELFQRLNEEDNVTIIQVTHSERNAEYSQRILHLLDGRIVNEELLTTGA